MSSNHNTMAQSGGKEKSIDLDSSAVDTKGTRESNKNPRKDQTTTTLIIILITIIVVIASLVGIVIYNLINQNNQTQEPNPSETSSTAITTADQFYPGISDITRINEEAEKIYNNDPSNTDKVINLYLEIYNQKISENDIYFAQNLIYDEQRFFIKHGSEEGELAALISFDYSNMDGSFSYQFLNRILELADKLNKPEIRQKYEPLAAEAKAADDERARKTQEYVDKFNAELQQAEAAAQENKKSEEVAE